LAAAPSVARADAPVSRQTINQNRAATPALPPSPGSVLSLFTVPACFFSLPPQVKEKTKPGTAGGKKQ